MKLSDFRIGLDFLGHAGLRWRCTDVGTRTVCAILLTGRDPALLAGPPFVSEEVVFDEHEIEHCHLTEEEAIRASLEEHRTSGHPGYPSSAVGKMTEARCSASTLSYPNLGVLRFDRLNNGGELLHPYAARQDDGRWLIMLYLPFPGKYEEMPEIEFLSLPLVSKGDLRERAKQSRHLDR